MLAQTARRFICEISGGLVHLGAASYPLGQLTGLRIARTNWRGVGLTLVAVGAIFDRAALATREGQR